MTDYGAPDIDLRPYITNILKNWYWILGLGLLAGILAYVASGALLSPVYEATALVSVNELRQRVEFDPRIVTEEQDQPPRVYSEIAMSDEVLSRLRESVPEVAAFNLPRIRAMLDTSPGSDPSLIRITARNTDPELAAALANGLAGELVAWANRTYGDLGEEQLRFFEQRLEDAATDLRTLEDELIEFQSENRSTLLENEFLTLQTTHAELLAKQKDIDSLLRDIDSFLAVAQNSGSTRAQADDQFTALILRLRAFGGPATSEGTALPWQLQVGSSASETESTAEVVQQVSTVRAALEVQAEQTDAALKAIEPKMLAVQRDRQEALATQALLQRQIDLAVETYTAVSRAVEEKRITSQDTNTAASVASRSAVPSSPTGPRQLFNALAAFVGVSLLVTFIIIIRTWWLSSDDEAMPVAGDTVDSIPADGN